MNKKSLTVIFIISAIIGFALEPKSKFSLLLELHSSLIEVASIIFALVGIWVSILDPTALLNKTAGEQTTPKERLALQYLEILIPCGVALAAIILFGFILRIIPIFDLNTLSQLSRSIGKMLALTLLTFFYIFETWAALAFLIPAFKVDKHIKDKNDEENFNRSSTL